MAERRRRNIRITSITRAMVSSSVVVTSWIESRIDNERSLSTWIRTEEGSSALMRGMAWRTASTTATVLASGWRSTCRLILRSPLTQLPVLMFSTLSSTVATSERRTGCPFLVATINSPNSLAFMRWSLASMISVWRAPSSEPSGVLVLAAAMAEFSSLIEMSRVASLAGSTLMRTAYRFCPLMVTWAIPSRVDSTGEIRLSA